MARASTVSSSVPPVDSYDPVVDDGTGAIGSDENAQAELEAEEAQARRGGWKPLPEFRGDPGTWVTAKEFNERGQNFLPFVKKERDELRGKVDGMTREMEGMRSELQATRKDMQRLLDFSRKASQAGYDKAIADMKATQRDAYIAGDATTGDRIGTEIEQMQEARDEVVQQPEPEPERPTPKQNAAGVPQALLDWVEENKSWYNSDPVLNAAMILEHNKIIAESPGMPLAEQLEAAKDAVMEQFPDKFGRARRQPANDPPPRRPQGSFAPTPPAPRPRGKTGIDAIEDPTERQQAREGFARAKRNTPDVTEAEYLEIWNDPHADVLDVVSRHKSKG
jgi:hypothetical protein